MVKKLLAVILMMFFCTGIISPKCVYADAIDDAKAQKAEADRQVLLAKQRLEQARKRAQRAGSDFRNVVVKLGKLQQQSDALNSRVRSLQSSIKNNQQKLEKRQKDMVERQDIYKKRLREIYIDGQISYLDVLLGAEDFGDFVGRVYLLDKVVNRDIDMLKEISGNIRDIKEITVQQGNELEEIKSTQTQISQAKVSMGKLKEKRRTLLEQAESAESEEEAKLNQFNETSERIGQMLKEMEKEFPQRFADKADNFIWPCCGVITSYAGWRIHPVFGTKKYHSGMDIGVDYYTPIRAANRGKVTYSGWMDGYGNVIMIDHGEGLVSLYAHNSSLKCNEGDFVKQGQEIASSGATGWATGPHCHFEIRLHGDVVDPLNYISEKDNIY